MALFETVLCSRVTRHPPHRVAITTRKTASGHSCKNLREIQRSDQKLWPFRTGTLVSSDETSASQSSDSTSTTRKTASGKSCKNLWAIQRSDQKLWPFRTGNLVSSYETSASHSSDSTSITSKTGVRKLLLKFKGDPTV